MFVGSDDMGDFHLDVIDDAREIVERRSIGPHDHEVADLVGRVLDVAFDQVMENESPPGWNLEP